MNRYTLNQILGFIGDYACIEASNGKECIEKVQAFYKKKICYCKVGISLIFMDIEMPIMDGYKATAALQRMIKSGMIPDIPIVAITAYPDEKAKCLEAGMIEFGKNIITSKLIYK
jgi:CheY-like chemotaxis protein